MVLKFAVLKQEKVKYFPQVNSASGQINVTMVFSVLEELAEENQRTLLRHALLMRYGTLIRKM